MPLYPDWQDIAIRLLLTLIASGLIGFNRQARGHAAGFRTTILVGLAAAVAMAQTNILLPVSGKTPESFAVMDLMRLPLGILTGVGFIGAGAIFRRADLVTGVTTAATLWMVTVIGLCFGGGQIGLGTGATVLALLTLWGLRSVDRRIPREHRATLTIAGDCPDTEAVAAIGRPLGYKASFKRVRTEGGGKRLSLEISWTRTDGGPPPTDLLARVGEKFPVLSFELEAER
jgi:putative Mg2+ transporter-C (MgtC) family protein